jgi:hypothetical protein
LPYPSWKGKSSKRNVVRNLRKENVAEGALMNEKRKEMKIMKFHACYSFIISIIHSFITKGISNHPISTPE